MKSCVYAGSRNLSKPLLRHSTLLHMFYIKKTRNSAMSFRQSKLSWGLKECSARFTRSQVQWPTRWATVSSAAASSSSALWQPSPSHKIRVGSKKRRAYFLSQSLHSLALPIHKTSPWALLLVAFVSLTLRIGGEPMGLHINLGQCFIFLILNIVKFKECMENPIVGSSTKHPGFGLNVCQSPSEADFAKLSVFCHPKQPARSLARQKTNKPSSVRSL